MKIILTEDQIKILMETFNDDDLNVKEKIIKGFKLKPFYGGFENSWTSENDNVSNKLIDQINKWINKGFPHSPIVVKREPYYNKIRFFKKVK